MHSKILKGLSFGLSFTFFEYLSFESEFEYLRISCKFRIRLCKIKKSDLTLIKINVICEVPIYFKNTKKKKKKKIR
jgi:hypothetical protein